MKKIEFFNPIINTTTMSKTIEYILRQLETAGLPDQFSVEKDGGEKLREGSLTDLYDYYITNEEAYSLCGPGIGNWNVYAIKKEDGSIHWFHRHNEAPWNTK